MNTVLASFLNFKLLYVGMYHYGCGARHMEKFLLALQHRMNPLHVYCRLIERGMNREASLRVSRVYEHMVFRWLTPLTVVSISFCRLLDNRRQTE